MVSISAQELRLKLDEYLKKASQKEIEVIHNKGKRNEFRVKLAPAQKEMKKSPNGKNIASLSNSLQFTTIHSKVPDQKKSHKELYKDIMLESIKI